MVANLFGQLAPIADHVMIGEHAPKEAVELAAAGIDAIEPASALEGHVIAAMLGCQYTGMEFLRRATHEDVNLEAAALYSDRGAKLLRTFGQLVEVLCVLRGKGPTRQVVTVEHVTIEPGGQAIVGAVTRTGGTAGGNHAE